MKTKKVILLLSAILLTIVGNAQEAAQFQIDDTHCLLLDNYCANCELQLYSTPQGGKMLKVVKTDANGKLVANFSAKNAPAFSLNKYTVTNSQGNDYVHHFPNIEFHAKDIKLSVEAATVYIRWDAIVYNKNDIQFEIWKGEGGHDQLERIAIIKPSNDLNNSYVFDDIYKAANSYELRIVKDGIVERYATSRLADATNLSGVKVYPTVIKDNFFIDLDETGRTIYEVYNLSGQLLKKGKLNDQYNQVYLADYPVGSYVLKVSHNGTIQRFQLTKN